MKADLHDVATPCLLLDAVRFERNCARMGSRVDRLGVALRPHMKTAKSVEAARVALAGRPPRITVSTIAEARLFAGRGFSDLTLAVTAMPDRLDALAPLVHAGARIGIVCDDPGSALRLADRATTLNTVFHMLVEIDSGEHRSGIAPDAAQVIAIARIVASASHLRLDGVLTHAGQAYGTDDPATLALIAEEERAAAVAAARRIREDGHDCPVVSVGSTPTLLSAQSLDGVTEARPGVYMLMDLDQMARGMCGADDIAVSVLATVIGHSTAGLAIVDAGAIALSKDQNAARRRAGVGYGIVEPVHPIAGSPLFVQQAYQEHGMVAASDGSSAADRLPVGARVRIRPNHACMTAAAYPAFLVTEGDTVVACWPRATGWS